jgi:hypothetical protein
VCVSEENILHENENSVFSLGFGGFCKFELNFDFEIHLDFGQLCHFSPSIFLKKFAIIL